MNKTTTRHILLLFLVMSVFQYSNAQMLWPGDVNNNGVVNGVDVLFWGVAYNNTGSPRSNATTNWEAQPVTDMWSNYFPGNLNYAFADGDGNGTVGMNDLDNAIKQNFGQTHGFLTPDAYNNGQSGIDPPLLLQSIVSSATPGMRVDMKISLGTEQLPANHFHGITFTLRFNEEYVKPNGVFFQAVQGAWYDIGGANSAAFFHVNDATGLAEITLTRLDQANVSGLGLIGTISFIVEDLPVNLLPALLKVQVENVKMIDASMNTYPVARNEANVEIVQGITANTCPDLINPVCGSNGVTYINSCYAEAAGVTDYTEGVCFGGCINPAQMNPNANCNFIYQPVCGCNGMTYVNECVAAANGVTSYTPGPCNANSTCYDPIYVVTSSGTTEDPNTGVISLNCPANNQPVCGCNGITYPNACVAEASGITFYTAGSCNTICVNPQNMNPNAVCPTIYNPVCGCNGVTYSNSCVADAAGVMSYTPGVCGVSSPWCAEAIPIQCGDYFPYETTVGAGNQISAYPGCSGGTFLGNDRVYVLNKTTAGDLQIGIEILTPNMDLDLFLLTGNCNQLTCLRSSTTSNSQTNNEGIILEDAPIGTYYIVVDGQYAGSQGDYRLEVSCGYLYCGDAVPLVCGQPYNGNNINGHDDVSLYGCGNVLNVENNGPEIVHYFSVTQAGQVTINLSGLTNNLELFLLNSCDRGDCLNYSQNAGNANESITAFLQPGLYYVVVDGYNGATSPYTLTVNCTSACNFSIVSATSTPAGCSQNNGSITVTSYGGHPGYIVSYSGPVSGTFATYANTNTIPNLPAGTYIITKTDCFGCSDTEIVTVASGGNLNAYVTPHGATCGMSGYLSVVILNGQAPYNIYVSGPVNTSLTTNSSSFNITNLPAGNYTISITSANGCSIIKYATITQGSSSFNFTATPHPGACGQPGYIQINTTGGVPPYNITVSGPISGYATSNASNFNIINLPGGTYTITIEDGNWCTQTRVVTLQSSYLNITATAGNGVCGQSGSIIVNITNGSAPYIINWNGPVNGSATTSNPNYVIQNLPSGTYSIFVEDGNWCSGYKTVYVNNAGGSLSTYVTANNGGCGQPGSIWVDINNGAAPYTINWTGPASGSATTSNNWYSIANLPGGSYTVYITDANGCSSTHTVYIISGGNFVINATGSNGVCGQPGSILVTMIGGSPNYLITWNGPVSGSTSTAASNFTINNLPPGAYVIQVTDAQGCSRNKNVTITNTGGGLTLQGIVTHATCVQFGAIWLDILGGTGPYTVSWTGPVSGSTTIQGNGYNIFNLPAGTYVVTVVAANGCTGTKTFTVLNQGGNISVTLVANNANCAQQYGAINVITSGGSGPYTIVWNGPVSGSAMTSNTNYQINQLPAGTYTVTVTASNGCSGSNTVTINASGNLNIITTPIPGLCGMNGSIWLDITNGSAPYVITWTGPVSGSITIQGNGYNIPNLPPGTYIVTVTGANGCTDSEVVVVTSSSATYVVNTALINNGCGQYNWIWIDIIGGSPTYTIIWTGPSSGSGTSTTGAFEIMDLPPGTYTIKVTDATGCMVIKTVIIYQEPNNRLVLTPIPGLCGQLGAIWVDIINSQAPYILTWTGPVSGSTTLTGNGYNIPNLPGGTYTIFLTDANGCTDVEIITLPGTQNQVDVTGVAIPGVCGQNGQIHLGITGGTTPYTIVWTGTVNGTATTSNNFYNILNLPNGTYTMVVTDANGCTDTVVITLVNGVNTLEVIGVAIPGVCGQNGQIHLGITGGSIPYTIVWTGPVNGSTTTSNNFYNILNLPSGTYTIVVTDANGCTDSVVVILVNGGNPVDVTGVAVPGVCGQNGQIHLGITGGTTPYTIVWTGPVNGTTTTSNNFYNILNLPSGTYTIVVTDVNGCTDTVVITLTNIPNTLDLTGVAIPGVCGQNGQIHLGITGGTTPYTIVWTGPVNGSTTTSNNFYNILNLPSGTYVIVVTDANGCTDTVTIILTNGLNTLDLTGVAVPGVCGQNGQIHLGITGGTTPYTIVWTGPVNGSTTTSNNFYNILNLPSGTYVIVATDANGCTDTVTITLTNGLNTLDATAVATPGLCGANGSILVSITGGTAPYNITWSGPVSGSTSTGNTSYNIVNLPSGAYTIVVTDVNGCNDTVTITLTNTANNLSFTRTVTNGICGQNGSILINITSGTPAYTIVWAGPVSGSATTGANSYNIPNLPSGTYTLMVTGSNGCSQQMSATVTVSENDIDITDTANVGLCGQEGSVGLIISGGSGTYNIMWSGPESGSTTNSGGAYTITGLPSGTYNITVTDSNGCSETETTSLINTEDDLELTATGINGLCGQAGSITVSANGGNPPFTITWGGPTSGSATSGNTTFNIPNLQAGSYTVGITDVNGCFDTKVVNITTSGSVNLSLTGTNATCVSLASISATITGGAPNYTISWTGPSSGSQTTSNTLFNIPNLAGGTYVVTVVDANGCTNTKTIVLTSPAFNLDLNAVPHNGLCGQNGFITVNITGGMPGYTITWNGPVSGNVSTFGTSYTISNTPNGTYNISVTDASGCTDAQTVTIVNTNNGLSIDVTAVNGVCGNLGSIWIDMLNGTPPFTIMWTGPVNGSTTTSGNFYDIPNLPGGTYTIKVTDLYNCMGQQTVVLTNEPDDLSGSLSVHPGACDGPGSITVNINGLHPPFTITWNGTNSMGSAITSASSYTINNLPTGVFFITITDLNGCTENLSTQLVNSPDNLDAIFSVIDGNCVMAGAIGIIVQHGAPPYTIHWNGPASGTVVWQDYQYKIAGLISGDYIITITDGNGCVYESEAIWIDGQIPASVANFTHTTSGLTTTFTNTSTPGAAYLWSFGDGTTSTATNPVHQYYGAGSYQVCLSVMNACGTTNICKTVNIVLPSNLVILDVGEVTGVQGSTIQIPVRIQNCQNLVSLAGSVSLQNPAVAIISGVTPGVISPQFSPINKTFNYFSNSGQGLAVNQNDILFYLTVQLTGPVGSSTDIFLVNTPLAVEVGSMVGGTGVVLPHMTVLGRATVGNTGMASGEVTTFWGEGIPNALVRATDGSMVAAEMTDQTGHYMLPDLPLNEEYILEAQKDTLHANGLSTYALFIGQRFILGLDPPQIYSPYQVIAGDANCNDAFTTLDLFLIQQLIIGARDRFLNCPSWVFVASDGNMPDDFNAYNVFPYRNRDTMMLMSSLTADFVGVKVGDILGQADPGQFHGGTHLEERYQDDLILLSKRRGAQAGEEVEVRFRSENFNDIVSYQTALGFDPEALEFLSIEGGQSSALSNVVAGEKLGSLRLSWFNTAGRGVSALATEDIFTIRFRAKTAISDLSDVLNIEPGTLRTEAHNARSERLNIVLRWEDGVVQNGRYELYQNTPNPLSNETTIRFELPEAMAAELILYDEMGRIIKQVSGDYAKGINQIELTQLNLAGGVYFYTLKAGAFAATKSMVVLNK